MRKFNNLEKMIGLLLCVSPLLASCGNTSFSSKLGAASLTDGEEGKDILVSGRDSTTPRLPEEECDTSCDGKGKGKKGARHDLDSAPRLSEDEMRGICQKQHGLGQMDIKITGNQKEVTETVSKSVAIGMAGNFSKLNLKALPPEDGSIKAICLVVHGNQAEANVNIEGQVDVIYVTATGNMPNIHINVAENGKLKDSRVSVHGNQGRVVIAGKGELGCSNLKHVANGNDVAVLCSADAK